MAKKKLPGCCKSRKEYKGNNPLMGIMYGLIPHIGCIMFIIGSILGVTILMQFFRPLLMNRYIFHYLILISIGFATFSSYLYLRKNNLLSWEGIKVKEGYLITMFSSTIGINILLFFFVFPFMANISLTGAVIFDGNPDDLGQVRLSVNIPCPGHAPLISNELGTIDGVINTRYSFPNNFDVSFDKTQTSLDEILSLEVFSEYPATVVEDSGNNGVNKQEASLVTQGAVGSGCAGGCGAGCSAGCAGGCGV